MEIIQNTDYFEAQLSATNTMGENLVIDQLISDMVSYARTLEVNANTVPPVESLPQKPKPDGSQSPQFRAIIDQQAESINADLLSVLEVFLGYIETLESL